MANQLAGFDPVSRFQTAQSNAQLAGRNDFAMQQAQKNAPRQNALADIQLRQAQAGEQSSIRDSGISIESQRVKFLNQFGKAMEGIPDIESRMQAAKILEPMAQKFGIDPAVFTPENLSDNGINQLLTTTNAFINDPSKLSAAQQEFQSLTQNLSPEDAEKARRIKLRLDAPAGTSSQERMALDPRLSTAVAKSQAEIKGAGKFAELSGASRAKAIDSGIEKMAGIDKNILNLDRAIDALNRGAGTGAIEKMFPSIRAATVELNNIQSELALDVVGATTFGALSAGELNLAKEVALPTGLNKNELLSHLENKKIAQQKLKSYFNEQIQFLDEGGTVAGFIRSKERQSASAQEPAAQQIQEGQTATNPQTGQTITFRNGQWVGQ